MVENSVISTFEGVYSLVLMRKVRKLKKIYKCLEKKIFQPRVEKKISTLDFFEFS